MLQVTPYETIPAYVAEAQPTRRSLTVLSVGFASASAVIAYMALVAFYIGQRASVLAVGEQWLPEGVTIPLTQPNYMGLTLAFSVITAWWSVAAVRNNDFSNAGVAYGLTILFGIAFLVQTAYLLSLMEMEARGSEPAVLIYTLIIAQLLVMIGALVFMASMALRTLGGEHSATRYESVVGSSIFWTVSVFLYAVLWYAVYITK